MPAGFFTAAELLSRKPDVGIVPHCPQCGLDKTCQSKVMPVDGQGQKKILLVAEAPGKEEDEQNRPLVGKSGRLLETILEHQGIDMRRDCWIANALRCRPPENRNPTDKEIGHCRPLLRRALLDLEPDVVILLGKYACQSLLGWIWKENVGDVGRWVGWRIPSQQLNIWICPTWHPSYILRNEGKHCVLDKLFAEHLRAAGSLRGKPWQEAPHYERQVECLLDPSTWADRISAFMPSVRPVAVDFETTTLKPDSESAEIVCCALSDGQTTISYPWSGAAIRMTSDLLRSRVPKIGYHIKFEERWCRKILGHGIRHWVWDGMLAAHILDNRPKIGSLKFQAFVHFGQAAYDAEVKPYFETEGSNRPNRIREVPLPKLLRYCGTDALLEWKMAQLQSQQLGIKL